MGTPKRRNNSSSRQVLQQQQQQQRKLSTNRKQNNSITNNRYNNHHHSLKNINNKNIFTTISKLTKYILIVIGSIIYYKFYNNSNISNKDNEITIIEEVYIPKNDNEEMERMTQINPFLSHNDEILYYNELKEDYYTDSIKNRRLHRMERTIPPLVSSSSISSGMDDSHLFSLPSY